MSSLEHFQQRSLIETISSRCLQIAFEQAHIAFVSSLHLPGAAWAGTHVGCVLKPKPQWVHCGQLIEVLGNCIRNQVELKKAQPSPEYMLGPFWQRPRLLKAKR